MTTFSRIAEDFLNSLGYHTDQCKSEEEAKEKAAKLSDKSKNYPVYFFQSDTSGEKPYEEFYTEEEDVVNDKFNALGVIRVNNKPSIADVENIFIKIKNVLSQNNIAKKDIVAALQDYLPNFEHIETGKSLDQKM